jgi:hypothetical protein
MGGACSTYGEMRSAYKIFVEKHEGMWALRKRRHVWKYFTDPREIIMRMLIGFMRLRVGTGGAVVNMAMNLRIP